MHVHALHFLAVLTAQQTMLPLIACINDHVQHHVNDKIRIQVRHNYSDQHICILHDRWMSGPGLGQNQVPVSDSCNLNIL